MSHDASPCQSCIVVPQGGNNNPHDRRQFGPRALPLLACGGSNTPLLHLPEEEEEEQREHEREGKSKVPSPCLKCGSVLGSITVGQLSWRLTLALWFQFLKVSTVCL